MKLKDIIDRSRDLSRPYRVASGRHFRLKDFDPEDTGKLDREDKPKAQEALATGTQALAEL